MAKNHQIQIASLKGINTARQGVGVRVVVDSKEIEALLARLGRAGSEGAKVALGKVADKIVAQAKTLAPVGDVDGGALRDSIRRTRGTISKKTGNVVVSVLAGGEKLAQAILGRAMIGKHGPLKPRKYVIYAILQHEDLTLHHDDGQAKYLEQPVFRFAPDIPGAILEEVSKVMR